MTISVLIPVPSDAVRPSAMSPRLASLKGKVVGVMYNAKGNAEPMLTFIADNLKAQYGAEVLAPVRTRGVYLPDAEQFQAMASKADVVLVGLGDCGSCSACSIELAADFERAGVPAVAICTTPFLRAGQAMAARQGMPDLPFVTLQHPLSSLDTAELRQRAEVAAPQAAAMLLASLGGEDAALSQQWRQSRTG
ncbi:MAG TPA: hypothetical protein VHW60_04370 [Caulobacteraceae bacterium]|jgi:hypothetical protein|nr:hypothetical protein [Caulobacteraceae bacterium]